MTEAGINIIQNHRRDVMGAFLHSSDDRANKENFEKFGDIVSILQVVFLVFLESFKDRGFFPFFEFCLTY